MTLQKIPFLEEKLAQIALHFLVSTQFFPESPHLVSKLEALWSASGRELPGRRQSIVTEWGRFVKQGNLPPDLIHGLCNMYLGLTSDMLLAKSMDEYRALVNAHQAVARVIESNKALHYYHNHRAHLTTFILPYYAAVTANPELPVVTRPGWIPDRPIPMGLPGSEPQFIYDALTRPPPAPRIPGMPASLHEVRRSLSPKGKMRNDEIYRPLGIEVTNTGLHLVCGHARYFDFHDSCEILGLELSSWMDANEDNKLPNPDGSDLPLRGPAENIFNLRNRAAVLGVSTLLIALDYEGADWYFRHERSLKVAVNPGAWSVVPSGTFQPFAPNLIHHDRDFNIRSTVLRELAEELLGKKEYEEAKASPYNLERSEGLRDFVELLNSNRAKLYFLGIGFDPVNAVPEVMTTLIFRANDLPSGTIGRFKTNFEGDSFHRERLSAAALRRFASGTKVHTAYAACARLAANWLDQLLADFGRRRLRVTA